MSHLELARDNHHTSLSEASLDELAAIVRRENEEALQAVSAAFEHAVNAGNALNEAFLRTPRGEWKAWLESCGLTQQSASDYRRIAYFAPELRRVDIATVGAARRHLKANRMQVPWRGGHVNTGWPVEMLQQAQAMRSDGATYKQIAEEFGVSQAFVWEGLNPRAAKKYQQRRIAERSLLRRARRDKEMKVAGGATYESYSLLRKCAQVLQTAIDREANREAKVALTNALTKVHHAEDEMVRAVRLTDEQRSAA